MKHKDKVTSIDITHDLIDEEVSAYTIHYDNDNPHAGCSIEAYTNNGTTYIHQTIYKTEFYQEVYMSRFVMIDKQEGSIPRCAHEAEPRVPRAHSGGDR